MKEIINAMRRVRAGAAREEGALTTAEGAVIPAVTIEPPASAISDATPAEVGPPENATIPELPVPDAEPVSDDPTRWPDAGIVYIGPLALERDGLIVERAQTDAHQEALKRLGADTLVFVREPKGATFYVEGAGTPVEEAGLAQNGVRRLTDTP